MKFNSPAADNPIDRLRVIGRPTERIDGPLKTTGSALYAYERHDAAPDAAYGCMVGAAIAKGRVRSIDLSDAERAPDVIAIVTAENAGRLGQGKRNAAKLLGGPEVEHYHQALAVVVAETFEQARAAANLVRVDYARGNGRFDLQAEREEAVKPQLDSGPADTATGDFEGAFASAPVKLDETYTTPSESHAMMEPHASMAAWDGDKLTLWTSNQMIHWGKQGPRQDARDSRRGLASDLALYRGRVRVQTVSASGRGSGGARRARGETAREGRASAPAGLQ